jgi:hypothetical protein
MDTQTQNGGANYNVPLLTGKTEHHSLVSKCTGKNYSCPCNMSCRCVQESKGTSLLI